jgi:hypothetical protein
MSRSEEAPFGASSGSFRRPSRPSGATGEPLELQATTAWNEDAEAHLAAAWKAFDAHAPEAFRRLVVQAVQHAPPAIAEYELGGVHDSFGEEALAEPRYRRALELGLEPDREAQCRIQLTSTTRNLGRAEEGLELLRPLLEADAVASGGDTAPGEGEAAGERAAVLASYAPQARGFAALCLASLGRDREAVRMAVAGIGASVTRYSRSLQGYAAELPDA